MYNHTYIHTYIHTYNTNTATSLPREYTKMEDLLEAIVLEHLTHSLLSKSEYGH